MGTNKSFVPFVFSKFRYACALQLLFATTLVKFSICSQTKHIILQNQVEFLQNPTPVVAKQLFGCKRCLDRLVVACFLEVNFQSSNTMVFF